MEFASLNGGDLAIVLTAAGVIWTPIIGGLVAIYSRTSAINRSVNHRDPGEPTLVQMVDEVRTTANLAATTAAKVKERLDAKDVLDTKRHNDNVASMKDLAKSVKAVSTRVGRLEPPKS